MKLYYPKDHYDKQYRSHVFPLLKPFIKNKGFTDIQRVSIYGVSEQDFSIAETIEEATTVILPMSWNYYLNTKQVDKAIRLISAAASFNKKVIIITLGDFGVKIPNYKNIIVLRNSGYRSKLPLNHQAIPVFIKDPLQYIYSTNSITTNYSKIPVIGFCGQTNASLTNAFKEILKVLYRNAMYYLRFSDASPQKVQSTTYNRSQVLNIVKQAKKLTPNFIERKQYRAGVVSVTDRKTTELEFYDNMLASNYVVCVRGAGNFSVRLYETLAMGRIPVFVNTDCLMPISDVIEWKKHVVWIESNELNELENKVLEFHNNLSIDDFKRLQESNRNLWENELSFKGFFKSFFETNNI